MSLIRRIFFSHFDNLGNQIAGMRVPGRGGNHVIPGMAELYLIGVLRSEEWIPLFIGKFIELKLERVQRAVVGSVDPAAVSQLNNVLVVEIIRDSHRWKEIGVVSFNIVELHVLLALQQAMRPAVFYP